MNSNEGRETKKKIEATTAKTWQELSLYDSFTGGGKEKAVQRGLSYLFEDIYAIFFI